MHRLVRQTLRLLASTLVTLPAMLPMNCSKPLLEGLTPFLIDGSNRYMHDLIFFAAPFVLP